MHVYTAPNHSPSVSKHRNVSSVSLPIHWLQFWQRLHCHGRTLTDLAHLSNWPPPPHPWVSAMHCNLLWSCYLNVYCSPGMFMVCNLWHAQLGCADTAVYLMVCHCWLPVPTERRYLLFDSDRKLILHQAHMMLFLGFQIVIWSIVFFKSQRYQTWCLSYIFNLLYAYHQRPLSASLLEWNWLPLNLAWRIWWCGNPSM